MTDPALDALVARCERAENALRAYAKESTCPDCDGTRTVMGESKYKDCGWCGATGFISADDAWDEGNRARSVLAEAAQPAACDCRDSEAALEDAETALQKVIDYVPEGFISPMDDEDSMNYRAFAHAYFAAHPDRSPRGITDGETGGEWIWTTPEKEQR